jgi:hypothetical protein
MVLERVTYVQKKKKNQKNPQPNPYTLCKVNSKWIKDQRVKHKSSKLLTSSGMTAWNKNWTWEERQDMFTVTLFQDSRSQPSKLQSWCWDWDVPMGGDRICFPPVSPAQSKPGDGCPLPLHGTGQAEGLDGGHILSWSQRLLVAPHPWLRSVQTSGGLSVRSEKAGRGRVRQRTQVPRKDAQPWETHLSRCLSPHCPIMASTGLASSTMRQVFIQAHCGATTSHPRLSPPNRHASHMVSQDRQQSALSSTA